MKMKKIIIAFVIIFLQSCTIHSEFVFHKNKTISAMFETNIDADSLAGFLPSDTIKYPNKWISLYDFALSERKTILGDSILMYKHIYQKWLYKDDVLKGMALRIDQVTEPKDFYMDWDGKKLTFNLDKLYDEYVNKDTEENKESKNKLKKNMIGQLDESISKELDLQVNLNFKFESPILSVKQAYENFKKIDDHTVQFSFNLKDKPNSIKKYDKEIIIITK